MTRTTTATTSTATTTTTPKAPGKQRRVRLAKDATSSSEEDTESNGEDTRGPNPTVSAKSRAASKTPPTRETGKRRRKALAGMATPLNEDEEPECGVVAREETRREGHSHTWRPDSRLTEGVLRLPWGALKTCSPCVPVGLDDYALLDDSEEMPGLIGLSGVDGTWVSA
ncbi:hypothetical protein DVH05_003684 [Phytophthora capsici]|nr:hypothetical protein DVH05_003684 [Phytophthora capsici]